MRRRLALFVFLMTFTISGFGKDVYLSIGGSVGNFRTDARIWNPSFTKDITIAARYLPAGNSDNSGVGPTTITIPKRSMAVYDDVVQSLFGGGAALGAVRLTSDDDFVATQRIYADESSTAKNGTLGQFVPGLEAATALRKGVLIQLKSNGARGDKGTFRTNWGGVNPNTSVANIDFTLYDRNNTVAGTTKLTLQPYGVFAPAEIGAFFGVSDRSRLANGWISFTSDVPVFLYASILDNGSEDPTFITASEDTGVAPVTPQEKTVSFSAANWFFFVAPSGPLAAGDRVKFIITSTEDRHGFTLFSPTGQTLISIASFNENEVVERTVTLPTNGGYTYVCAYSLCGEGHTQMTGVLNVGTQGTDNDRGGGRY